MLTAEALAAVRGRATLFDGLSFDVPDGHVLVLRGRNGSGKTTLLRMLAGLATPSSGRVLWDRQPIIRDRAAYHAALLYLGHLPAVSEMMSTRENLALWRELDGGQASPAELDSALEQVGLRTRRQLPARMLSQGQRRRIGLARLLLATRPLWLLDEPTTALDAAGIELLGHVVERHLGTGGTAVVATHQPLPIEDSRIRELHLG